ncbi:MAG: hypothetical protein ACRDZO_29340 [Egibacteraceae bacterium]
MLWWIGNLILLVVVFPVVLWLLKGVLTPVARIRKTVDDILQNGVALTGNLDHVPDLLAKTDKAVEAIKVGAVRYAGSVGRLLGS